MERCDDPKCKDCNPDKRPDLYVNGQHLGKVVKGSFETREQRMARASRELQELEAVARARKTKPTASFPNRKARRRSMKARGEFRKP